MLNFLSPNTSNIQDPGEWQANQRGEITEAQNARLNASLGFQSGCVSLVFIAILMPFFFTMGVFAIQAFNEAWFFGAFILAMLVLFAVIMFSQVGGLWQAWQRWNALKRDREGHSIRMGQGQLAFEKGAYNVQAAGRTLRLPISNNACGLKPGATYRFYYLEESGFVLSAEELYPASAAQAQNALLDILASANKFTLDDLNLNRNGEMTSAQRMRALPNMFFGLLFGLFPLGFGIMLFTSEQDLTSLIFPLIILLIFALFAGFMFVNGLLDLLSQSPLVTEGVGHKEKRTSRSKRSRKTIYYYVIDGTRFQVGQDAYQALVDGERYRVYALPRSKRLLTIEPL